MEEVLRKLEQQEKKLDDIHKTVRKIRIYFLTMIIITVVGFLFPLLGLAFVIPWFLKTMESTYQGLL